MSRITSGLDKFSTSLFPCICKEERFTDGIDYAPLEVDFPEDLLALIPDEKRAALIGVLAQDPRPGYRHDGDARRYGVAFAGYDVRFRVANGTVTDLSAEKIQKE